MSHRNIKSRSNFNCRNIKGRAPCNLNSLTKDLKKAIENFACATDTTVRDRGLSLQGLAFNLFKKAKIMKLFSSILQVFMHLGFAA